MPWKECHKMDERVRFVSRHLEGESISEFVETAAIEAARRRSAQEAFLARGRASLAKAKRTGEFYAAEKVVEDMRERLQSRMQALTTTD